MFTRGSREVRTGLGGRISVFTLDFETEEARDDAAALISSVELGCPSQWRRQRVDRYFCDWYFDDKGLRRDGDAEACRNRRSPSGYLAGAWGRVVMVVSIPHSQMFDAICPQIEGFVEGHLHGVPTSPNEVLASFAPDVDVASLCYHAEKIAASMVETAILRANANFGRDPNEGTP